MDQPGVDVSVIIPVYQNRATLEELTRRLVACLQPLYSFEIIYVDDACPQDSKTVLRSICAQNPRVSALILGRNQGQNHAVLAGLAAMQGQRAVILDADLQDLPETAPRLLGEMDKGYAAVFAGRRGRYESGDRLLSSRIFKTLLHLICGIPRDAGICMALDRQVVQRMLELYAPRPFIVAMVGCLAHPVMSLPVQRYPRPEGHSAYSSWKRLKTGVQAILWAILWKYWFIPRDLWQKSREFQIQEYMGARFQAQDGVL